MKIFLWAIFWLGTIGTFVKTKRERLNDRKNILNNVRASKRSRGIKPSPGLRTIINRFSMIKEKQKPKK